jgi:hypothetical protein
MGSNQEKCTIGGVREHSKLIEALREKLTKRNNHGAIEEIKVDNLSARMLPKQGKLNQPFFHIKLHAKKQENSNETWTTTLAMRKDNLYIVGFTGKDGKWFMLVDRQRPLQKECSSTKLDWDVRYKSIMNLKVQDQVKRTLSNTRLGMAFANRAVRRLSQYPDHEYEDENLTRLGLAGLIVLICESARMESIHKELQSSDEWDTKGVLIEKDVLDYIWDWGTVSAALILWQKRGYAKDGYPGDSSLRDALGIRLVLNSDNVQVGARVEIIAVSTENIHATSIKVIDDKNIQARAIYDHEGRQLDQVPMISNPIRT